MQWYAPENDIGQDHANGFMLLGGGSSDVGDSGIGTLIKLTVKVSEIRSVWAGFTEVRLALEKNDDVHQDDMNQIESMLSLQLEAAAKFMQAAYGNASEDTLDLPRIECTSENIRFFENFFDIDSGVMGEQPDLVLWFASVLAV